MAQINKPNTQFNTVLYTGNGSTQSITGVNFQPDWTWIKCRANAREHKLTDVVRGVTKVLSTNSTALEVTDAGGLTSFDSDGFTLGNTSGYNNSAETFVAWNWLAGGTAVSNTDGSITSSVSANTTAGFSIVSYTGTGANATVGHGLGVAPACIITKDRDSGGSGYWGVYHQSLGNGKALFLNTTDAEGTNIAYWNNTSPTSSVFTLGDGTTSNVPSENHIAYCFAEKKGFSKFGSYTGNGSANGTFVYTGFKPAFVMIKAYTGAAEWGIWDTKRNSFNETINVLRANSSAAEVIKPATDNTIDILSNGFKIRDVGGWVGTTGRGFIYMAFAENPLVGTNNIPATAR